MKEILPRVGGENPIGVVPIKAADHFGSLLCIPVR